MEDLNGDGSVGFGDLSALLAAWNTNPGGPPDFDGDGNVGFGDLDVAGQLGAVPVDTSAVQLAPNAQHQLRRAAPSAACCCR